MGCDSQLVERDTFANFFHDSEDFFNAFLALSILKWPVKDLQVVWCVWVCMWDVWGRESIMVRSYLRGAVQRGWRLCVWVVVGGGNLQGYACVLDKHPPANPPHHFENCARMVTQCGSQVLIADIFPRGPFEPMWTEVFRGSHPAAPKPLFAWDIARVYGSKNVCFKELAVAVLGAAAPMTVASWDSPCRGVALVRAYADFVVRALGLHVLNAQRSGGVKGVNVTYAARRASVQWPEKAFCDTERSFFDCAQLEHLQLRKLGRMVKNDAVRWGRGGGS